MSNESVYRKGQPSESPSSLTGISRPAGKRSLDMAVDFSVQQIMRHGVMRVVIEADLQLVGGLPMPTCGTTEQPSRRQLGATHSGNIADYLKSAGYVKHSRLLIRRAALSIPVKRLEPLSVGLRKLSFPVGVDEPGKRQRDWRALQQVASGCCRQ